LRQTVDPSRSHKLYYKIKLIQTNTVHVAFYLELEILCTNYIYINNT